MDIRGNKEHRAMIRESQLAAGQIAAGATALGKANHAATAFYHQAFFGLSIGIERMCKQVLIADYAIRHSGSFPDFKYIKNFGHILKGLIVACDEVGTRFEPDREHAKRPDDDIHKAVTDVLGEFANGTRYYNLDLLTGSSKQAADPVAEWWEKVGRLICARHYSAQAKQRDEANAQMIAAMLTGNAHIHHTSETGEHIGDPLTFARMTGPTKVTQEYGRMYVLQIVRWLYYLTRELAMTGGYTKKIPALFCFHEPYTIFNGSDRDFRKRKTYDASLR